MWKRLSCFILYIAIVQTPVVLAAAFGRLSNSDPFYAIGKNTALIGFMILALQPVLAARLKWIEQPFGLDVLMRHHKNVDIFAMVLICLHPLFLVLGGAGRELIVNLDLPWTIWAGKTALVIFIIGISISLFRLGIRLKFQRWRLIHDILGPVLIVLAFIHSWFAGSDIQIAPIRWLWIGILGFSMAIFLYHRWIRPFRLRRYPYRVIDVRQETKNVWTIKLAPPNGRRIFDYLPGQFQFITFHRGNRLPVEEHHWTISSSPTEKTFVSSTIKALGDFTATIGQTKPGDTATVHAPFGRFSYVHHPDENAFVFIAGGIGITPFISMLRHMRDTRAAFPVLLLYANNSTSEIVFLDELPAIEAGRYPPLRVIHVLNKPENDWNGERGFIDREKIERHCGKMLRNRAFYVCGPKGMLTAVIKTLRSLGVPKGKIHHELFAFPN